MFLPALLITSSAFFIVNSEEASYKFWSWSDCSKEKLT